MEPIWPQSTHPTTGEPIIRPRRPLRGGRVLEYVVTKYDIETVKGFAFTTIARTIFGDDNVSWVIRDHNLKVREQDLEVGDTIYLPYDAVDLIDNNDHRSFNLQTVSFFSDIESDGIY